jgi:hypothetical protein
MRPAHPRLPPLWRLSRSRHSSCLSDPHAGAHKFIEQLRDRSARGRRLPARLSVRSSRGVMTDGSATRGYPHRHERVHGDRALGRLAAPPEARARSFRCACGHSVYARPFPGWWARRPRDARLSRNADKQRIDRTPSSIAIPESRHSCYKCKGRAACLAPVRTAANVIASEVPMTP